MNIKKKAFGIVTTAMLVLPLVAGTINVQAEETTSNSTTSTGTVPVSKSTIEKFKDKTVNIEVNALKYTSTGYDSKTNNDGENSIPNATKDEKGTTQPVSKIRFIKYDVTSIYNDITSYKQYDKSSEKTDTAETTIEHLYAQYKDDSQVRQYFPNGVSGTTGDNGVATFENVRVTNSDNTKFAAYLIVQDSQTNSVAGNAAPMVVTMPAEKTSSGVGTGKYFGENPGDTIKLYPKFLEGSAISEPTHPKDPANPSENLPKDEVDPTKPTNPKNPNNIDNKEQHIIQSVDYGEAIDFGFDVTLPSQSNKITVDVNPNLIVKLEDDGKTPKIVLTDKNNSVIDSANYKATYKDNKIVITTNDTVTGKITVTYEASINKDTTPGKKLDSSVNLNDAKDAGGALVTYDLKSVYTGGDHFKVVDANNNSLAVTNGQFYLKNEAGEYALLTKTTSTEDTAHAYSLDKWVQKQEDATLIDLTKNGSEKGYSNFSVQGLKDGKYNVYQIGSHEQYVNPKADVLKDVNVIGLNTATEGQAANDTFTANAPSDKNEIIKNVKKGVLPSTGGTGIVVFLAVGTLLMGGSYLWFRRSKDSAEV